jgi:hypothetical protein
MRDGFGD